MRAFALSTSLLLTACGISDKETGGADTGTDTNTDSGDTDTHDSGGGTDTAIAIGYVFYVGDAQTTNEGTAYTWVSGHFGDVVENASAVVVCTEMAVWSDTGTAAAGGCPDCSWAFDLTLSAGTATGPACGALTGAQWPGLEGSWGFADRYVYVYGDTQFLFTEALMYYSTYPGDQGWFPLSYNYAGYGYDTGDANSFSFMTYAGYIYYYR